MHITDIIGLFEEWAPTWTAWEKDNVGLQVGDANRRVSKILVSLDVTKEVVSEAMTKKADLIVTHHPLLFRPPSAITRNDAVGDLVLKLAEHKIALFSAHTNLDFAKGGVSYSLAELLGLVDIRFLSQQKKMLAKIIVFVPEEHAAPVLEAMTNAGAGIIGEYSACAFQTKGKGSFRGSSTTHPFLGKRETLERIDEIRLEMVAPRALVPAVVKAMKAVHPYEEIAYDVILVENPNPNFGMGALGRLPKPLPLGTFLKHIKHALGSRAVRFTGDLAQNIQTVAVCGGSGSDLLPEALASGADVFVTADIRYHTFHMAVGSIALVDAGHFETEQIIVQPIANRLRAAARAAQEPLTVWITKHLTNPIQTF